MLRSFSEPTQQFLLDSSFSVRFTDLLFG